MIVFNIMLGKGKGGIENSFVNYCRCLINLGHKVHAIISPQAAIEKELCAFFNIQIHYLPNLGYWDSLAKRRLKQLAKKLQPQIILAHANRAISFCAPLQENYTTVGISHNYSIKHLKKYSHIITVTNHLKKIILSNSPSKHSIQVLPNTYFHGGIPLAPQQTKQVLTIGSLGRFVPKKGFEVFIQALSLLKEKNILFHAIIAGEGEQQRTLIALRKKYQLEEQLNITGWMPTSTFFSLIDIFCLPSLHEPFGMVLIEAFAHRKACVTTNSEGPQEIATDQWDALIAPIANPAALADQLETVLSSSKIRNYLATNAYNTFIKKYSPPSISQQLESIIQNLI